MALVASTASFHQKLTEPDVSINPGTQITHPGLPMLDGSSKSTFPVGFGTLSVLGCGGHSVVPELDLKEKKSSVHCQ